ncbi:helix-turn-helix domain-containing protein [Roseovarius aestuarii]|nr:helix-turn-helix domain-containing protein [Roseovarius aestuarii]
MTPFDLPISGKKIAKHYPYLAPQSFYPTPAASEDCQSGGQGVVFELQDMCNVNQNCILEPCVKPFERRNRIRTLLSQGVPAAQIARQLGVAPSTVYRIRSGQGAIIGDRAGYASIGTKVTEHEKAGLDRLVRAKVAPSRSALLRKMTRAVSGFYDPNPGEEEFLAEALRHLTALGGNFNQIAKDLSVSVKRTGEANPSAAQIERIRQANDEVEKIKRVVGSMLRNTQVKAVTLHERVSAPIPQDADDE